MTSPVPTGGARHALASNQRITLDDPDRVVIVAEGRLDVFALRMVDGEPMGPRRWLFSAKPGAALFGLPPAADASLRMMAVASLDSELDDVSLRDLRAAGAADHAGLAAVVDGWIKSVSFAVARTDEAQITVRLEPGQTVTVDFNRRTGATKDVVWARHLRGHSWYAGLASVVALKEGSGYFPLALGAWFLPKSQVELATLDTAAWLSADGAWNDFDAFRAVAASWMQATAERAEEAERARRALQAVADKQVKQAALVELLGTMAPEGLEITVAPEADALLEACKAIGRKERIDFRGPPDWELEEGANDPLAAICRASRVRMRRVALKGDWWTRNGGSILCALNEGKHPVAAIPTRRHGYELYNPRTGGREPVTATSAETLEPFGHVFYRPLPDKPVTTWALVRFVLTGMTGSLWSVAFLAVLSGLLGLFMPIATGFVFDQVIPSSMPSQLVQVFLGLVIAAASGATFDLVRSFAILRLEGWSASGMQAAVFDRLLQLPAPFFHQYSIGDLVSRVGGISAIRSLLSGSAITALLGGMTGTLNFFLLFYYQSTLAWISTLFVFLATAFVVFMSWRTLRFQSEIQEIGGKLSGLVLQLISGIAKLRVAGAEDRALATWAHLYARKVRLDRRASATQAKVGIFNDALPLLTSLTVFGTVGYLVDKGGGMDVAKFIAFNAALGSFMAAAIGTSNTLVNLVQIVPLMKRASVILREPPEVTADRPSPGRLTGRIEGRNLAFRYKPEDPLVLNGVSFFAEPGEFVAFVGPSGSGKSTTLRLLLGFESAESGSVYFDGQDLATIDVTAVRRQMGVVLQNSRMMAGDIFTNIIGSAPLSLDDAWEAAEAAGFADDVRDMPMQMHTVISEGGSTLSGGQRQRLLIARALVHKPRIILFDEATSALDNRTQRIVTESLDKMHATRIVIAHRLSTIQGANRIYVIDKGRVAEWGAFGALMEKGGVFAQLAARQLA